LCIQKIGENKKQKSKGEEEEKKHTPLHIKTHYTTEQHFIQPISMTTFL
jgi:hypothetical protein